MLRIHLTDTQRSELRALRRSDLPAVARDRPEMVFLSDAGWSPPEIASHPGRHPHTVRAALKGFDGRGPQSFYPDAPGPDPDHARRATVAGELAALLGRDRTWTARQLADALGPDIGIGHRQTLRYLALLKAGYRRTAQTVGHEQDPKKVERAEVVLADLKKSWGGPAEAPLPRRVRVLAVAADRVLVVPARAAEAGEVRVPPKGGG